MNFSYLTFSDGAKFALIARNLLEGKGYMTDFSFWGNPLFVTGGIPILLPYIMSFFMKVFGTTDFAVIMFSFTFYILLIVSVFLLARKLYSSFVGFLSSIAVASNINFLDYATSGASETLFAFEIVISMYLLSFKKLWINFIGFIALIAMYFTKPQAFMFIAGILLYWLILRLGTKKGLLTFLGFGLLGVLVDKFILYPLSFKYPVTPIFFRGIQAILTYSSASAVSDELRGNIGSTLTLLDVVKKTFYNLYNFYKAVPQILNPYLFALFLIGLFKKQSPFKISVIFITAITVLVTALTIPFYRYIHPIIPLVYIVAVATLADFLKNKKYLILVITIFAVGQTLGVLFLDSRFENKLHNLNKPPIYVLMSDKLEEVTNKDNLVLTNLDTWGSWYGNRKTVWFPLTPDYLSTFESGIDVIYLTSYKMDDDNYYMGKEWREIFNNPRDQKILLNYKFFGEYEFKANDSYENENGKSVLLVKEK